jgi:FdrA protein
MSIILNEVRRATYLDSIVLMRLSREIAALPGVVEAGLFIGTPANKDILRDAGILGPEGVAAEAGDLILALKARDAAAGQAALAQARLLLDRPALAAAPAGGVVSRSIRGAVQAMPDANLALISVPGHFAAAEARKAMALGLHAMIFSDNVPIEEEAALKREARALGLMVMGPDCGTAIIAGLPLAFANVVPRGDIGIVGASGTGIQEVSSLIARSGRGISHAIGTGGRDLKPEVGAITTLMAIDALDADAATKHIVLISKPPAEAVVRLVLDRVGKSAKPFTICFLGAENLSLPKNARAAPTLRAAADLALGRPAARRPALVRQDLVRQDLARQDLVRQEFTRQAVRGPLVRGLFAGGTFASEAQIIFRQAGLAVASNVPVPGAAPLAAGGHVMLDLGDDSYTRGRPHPMIDPAVRDAPLAAALADPDVGIILIDLVLGFGAHPDPAGNLAGVIAGMRAGHDALIIASVTGTDADPQDRAAQVRKLEAAGIIVAESNADAAEMALAALAHPTRLREAASRP